MAEATRIEIEFDERRYIALECEAERLGVDVTQVVLRATSAWIYEMADNAVLCTSTSVSCASN